MPKTTTTIAAPSSDVFSKTVPLLVQKHAFWESRKASMEPITITGQTQEDQIRTKSHLTLSKRLLNSDELRAIRHRDTAFRLFLQNTATPFRPGLYLIPLALVETVDIEATKWETERQALVDAAALAYPAHIEAMRVPLGPLFNELDYPSVPAFKSKFWVDWRFINFGVNDKIASVRADIFKKEQAKLERQSLEAQDMIEQHLRSSLFTITAHLRGLLAPKASGKRVGLRDNCLDKLTEFLATVESRNVTGDQSLAKVCGRLRMLSKKLDLEVLRDADEVRDKVADEMTKIEASLSALVTEGPAGRGIRLREEVA